jgi:uncharacterized protein (DUF488 family)
VFYRRKILLALLQLFEGQLNKTKLQKLLFLFTVNQAKHEYDFVPYRYGCFSFSANADLTTMVSKGLLEESQERFRKLDKVDYFRQLTPSDHKNLLQIKQKFGRMSTKALMRYTYVTYPFYAINSEVAADILEENEMQVISSSRPVSSGTVLFTIGYEGVSLEEYLTRLIRNDVKVLVDVRNNPLSMKYGFSKNQLRRYCESIGIRYIHFPEVGIQSSLRQQLKKQSDYDRLFASYKEQTLVTTKEIQTQILDLLKRNKRIALTCFEADICQCHRKYLAEAIQSASEFKHKVLHI